MSASTLKGLMGPISVACVWFGTHIGPGFASGAQLVQYFVGYGWLGVYVGPIVLMIISSWIVYYVLETCRLYQVYNYHEFYNVVFGRYRKIFVAYKELFVLLSSIVIASMSYASGGALLETLGIPFFIGGLATVVVVVALLLFGEALVRHASTAITVTLVVMVLVIGLKGVGPSWPATHEYIANRTMNASYGTSILNIVLYIAIFCSFVDSGMATSKGVIKSKRDSLITAILGSVLVGGCTMIMNTLFASQMPGALTDPLSVVTALKRIGMGSHFHIIYVTLAMLAVLSTGVGFMCGTVARYEGLVSAKLNVGSVASRFLIIAFFMVIAILLGQFGILAIVNWGYKIFLSYMGVPVIYIPFMFILPYWVHKKYKAGQL